MASVQVDVRTLLGGGLVFESIEHACGGEKGGTGKRWEVRATSQPRWGGGVIALVLLLFFGWLCLPELRIQPKAGFEDRNECAAAATAVGLGGVDTNLDFCDAAYRAAWVLTAWAAQSGWGFFLGGEEKPCIHLILPPPPAAACESYHWYVCMRDTTSPQIRFRPEEKALGTPSWLHRVATRGWVRRRKKNLGAGEWRGRSGYKEGVNDDDQDDVRSVGARRGGGNA
ncbi:hypothetical protein EV426DRAFT_720425 [Tirmania nivea]|nr:hypothetical protein EV426DRAFT_720425 [Tirmania nivea]